MADASHKPATYADLEAVPPHLVAEILFGHLVTHPRPAPRNGRRRAVSTGTSTNMNQPPFDANGIVDWPASRLTGWVVIDEPELHLGPNIVTPHIAGWRRERFAESPDKWWFEVPPDWVFDLLTPATSGVVKSVKRRVYSEAAVPFLWWGSPQPHMLEVFKLQAKDWLLVDTFTPEDELISPLPFIELKFSLGLLWPFDPPADPTT